jgi:hypothetical protein
MKAPKPEERRFRCYRKFTFSFITYGWFKGISGLDGRSHSSNRTFVFYRLVCVLPEEGSGTDNT